MTKQKKYVHYGCGLSAPQQWLNFDVSPTLRVQKIPFLGKVLRNNLNVVFPKNVRFGDIVEGLPIDENSCDGLYCSHTLEHLSLSEFRVALANSFKILKNGGIFRCVVPDLEFEARSYIRELENGNNNASLKFILNTKLGTVKRPKNLKGYLLSFFGNSRHLWMWDNKSLCEELKNAGFSEIRSCNFNDCEDSMFNFVETENRFYNAVAIECKKIINK
jgi:SAM-dependent methyltransferase